MRPPIRRLFRLALPRRVQADVDAELRFHLDERIEELMDQGLSREEAERRVRARFGDEQRVREEVLAIDRAGTRRQSLGALGRDVRVALRGLARSKGFTAAAVLTLALGIGANAAIFSAVNAVLLQPLPAAAAIDRLVVVRNDLLGNDLRDAQLSPTQAEDLGTRTDLFEASTAYATRRPVLTGIGEPRQLAAVRTIGRFAETFGVRPALGRFYRPDESEPGAPLVAVLSDALWRELSGGDPSFVGKTITLNDAPVEVIGVMPPSFTHPRATELYTPLRMDERVRSPEQRHSLYMTFVGRLREGITPEVTAAKLREELRRWERGPYAASHREAARNNRLHASSLVSFMAGKLEVILRVLMGAVVLVLCIACANVASLQMVRATGRAKEMAVRTALGAGRGAIIQQLLIESLLLSLAGGALGLLLGELTIGVLARLAPTQFPQLANVRLDGRAIAFTAIVSLVAGIAFGLLPALRAARTDLNDVMKDAGGRGGSAGPSRQRMLQGSVMLQVALTLVLLVGSALVTRSLSRLVALDPGFRADRVYTVKVSPPAGKYQAATMPGFYRDLVERVRGIPGVEAAGAAFGLPFSGDLDSTPFDLPDRPADPGAPKRHAEYRVVSGEYFESMGIAIRRGRALGAQDLQGAMNAVVIDETLARQFFGADDPVGRIITQLGSPTGNAWTIVGVAANVMRTELGEAPKATVYYPHAQVPWYNGLALTVRSSLDEAAIAPQVAAAVKGVEPGALLNDAFTMQERVEQSLGQRRLAMTVLGGFAGLSLVLALLGLYGVISYGMAQRTREIGIRLALGAAGGDVVRMVVRQGLVPALVGLAAGLALFLVVGRLLEALLFDVGVRDPVTIAACAAALALTAAVASWLPARRAAAVDPALALRDG